ncbi:regulatory-associated protein of mTOR, partial [Trichonephila clavata]
MAAFCVSCIVNNYKPGQTSAMQSSIVSICLEQLSDPNPKLRQWVAICLGRMWANYEPARWCGFEIVHMRNLKLYCQIPILRKYFVHFSGFLIIFENQFVAVGFQYMEEEKAKESSANHLLAPAIMDLGFSGDSSTVAMEKLRRVSSSTSISSMTSSNIHNPYVTLGYASVFGNIWKTLISLSYDPYPDVAKLAEKLINYIKNKVNEIHHADSTKNGKIPSMSEPSSPSGRPTFLTGDSPPSRMNGGVPHTGHDNSRLGKPANRWTESNAPYQQYQYFAQFNPIRKTFDKGPR